MSNIKIYSNRDSATSALRKMGIEARDYNLFIFKVKDEPTKVECNFDLADAYLKNKHKFEKPLGSHKFKNVKPPKPPKEPRKTLSGDVRKMILDGKSNQEIWALIKVEWKLDDTKKHYPTWYRCEMKRKGLLEEVAA